MRPNTLRLSLALFLSAAFARTLAQGPLGARGSRIASLPGHRLKRLTFKVSKRLLGLATVAYLLGVPAVHAALIPVSGTITVESVDPTITNISVGDQFYVMFVVDDSVTDTSPSVGAGQFPSLVISFSITALAGNAGTWNGTGVYDPLASNFVTNAFGNNNTFQFHSVGFPGSGTGLPFWDVDLRLGDYLPAIFDTGAGQSFADQFGGAWDPANAGFNFFATSSIRFWDGESPSPSEAQFSGSIKGPGDCAAVEAELLACEEDLASLTADEDEDGVPDVHDQCPGSGLGAVDLLGCTVAQFCSQLSSASSCSVADWMGDEPVGSPQDCRWQAGQCVPR